LLVGLLAKCFGKEPDRRPITPSVSLLIPAYNEEAHIDAKLRNSLALDYPRELLEIVVANDGSTDRTQAIAAGFASQGIGLCTLGPNQGKTRMLGQIVPSLRGEIVVFSDCSSELSPDALRVLVRSFADPKVGCVSGLYRLKPFDDMRAQGEGLYWRYETFIKLQESRLHSILGAHGAFYAIRKDLFTVLEGSSINDDYLIPMHIVRQGFRAVYDPDAQAWEREMASIRGELARRRRIAAGNCQQLVELRGMLSPVYGWVAFCFFSHKALRTLAPIFLLTMLASSFFLHKPERWLALAAQALLYGGAWLGYICQKQGRTIKFLSPPLYFCLGNLAMLMGLATYCFRKNAVIWERSR
jgi:cellulose synthase/poly-beta-1,6-N-acetylglucosamine synthase-like glycosyltransferase